MPPPCNDFRGTMARTFEEISYCCWSHEITTAIAALRVLSGVDDRFLRGTRRINRAYEYALYEQTPRSWISDDRALTHNKTAQLFGNRPSTHIRCPLQWNTRWKPAEHSTREVLGKYNDTSMIRRVPNKKKHSGNVVDAARPFLGKKNSSPTSLTRLRTARSSYYFKRGGARQHMWTSRARARRLDPITQCPATKRIYSPAARSLSRQAKRLEGQANSRHPGTLVLRVGTK